MLIQNLKTYAIKETEKVKKFISAKIGVDRYLIQANKLLNAKDDFRAKEILEQGLERFPKSSKIHVELAHLASKNKDWQTAVQLWKAAYELHKNKVPIRIFIQLAIAYRKVNCLDESEKILRKGIQQNKDNEELWNAYSYIAIFRCNWNSAIPRLEQVCILYESRGVKAPLHVYLRLSTAYRIMGKNDDADRMFNFVLDYFKIEIEKDRHGYRKYVLFDNGESRIEFYKKLSKTDKVVITFDSINMIWNNPSFGFNLLIKQNIDIIAVRKKRTRTYQQDLSLKDFNEAVNLLVKGYKDKIAYGFSLGAYGALYYASTLDCRILALSPRLSIHPQYGKKKMKGKFEFKHNNLPAYNRKISPIIVFDPKNKLDNTYINEGLLTAFPNANLIKVPYGGHGMGPHLLKMGLLKEFILTVINTTQLPVYRRELRKKSSTYYRTLGDICLKRNKPNWALKLVEYSLQLTPKDELCMRLKINVLRRMGRYEEAIEFANRSKEIAPDNRIIRILLIDLYIDLGNGLDAKVELEESISKFGKTEAILKRMKKISESYFKSEI